MSHNASCDSLFLQNVTFLPYILIINKYILIIYIILLICRVKTQHFKNKGCDKNDMETKISKWAMFENGVVFVQELEKLWYTSHKECLEAYTKANSIAILDKISSNGDRIEYKVTSGGKIKILTLVTDSEISKLEMEKIVKIQNDVVTNLI